MPTIDEQEEEEPSTLDIIKESFTCLGKDPSLLFGIIFSMFQKGNIAVTNVYRQPWVKEIYTKSYPDDEELEKNFLNYYQYIGIAG